MANWKTIAVKIEPEVYKEIDQMCEDGGYDSMGAAVRHLISFGLEGLSGRQGVEERTERANARAAAKRRLHILMQAAIQAFEADADYDGEDEEELDNQFDYDE